MKTILVDAVRAYVIEGEGVYQPLHELLETYPNKKIVLTQANEEKMREFGLDTLPYEVFTTSFNPMKTNPEYYKIVFEKYDLKVDDVVYFEHDINAVKSAQSLGIPTFFYDEEKKDIDALKTFLDINV